MVEIQTSRLELRQFSLEDAPGFYRLNLDPETLRYTGDKPFADVAEAAAFIVGYDHYDRYGYGRWSVYLRDEERYLGFCGLKYSPELDETDLGFRIDPAYQGRGFATEAGLAAMKLGFERYGVKKLVGRARAENIASHRVLVKLGFERAGGFEEDGLPWFRFERLGVSAVLK